MVHDQEAVVAQRLQHSLVDGQVPNRSNKQEALDQFLGYAAEMSGDYASGARALQRALRTLPTHMVPKFSFSQAAIAERGQALGAAHWAQVPMLPELNF